MALVVAIVLTSIVTVVLSEQTFNLDLLMSTSAPTTDWAQSFYSRVVIDPSAYDFGSSAADRIVSLPGQVEVEFNQYGGYITVDEVENKDLYYYFVESAVDSSNKPLILWLNGGPGCSSVLNGAFQEVGPFRVKGDGKGLFLNPYSWNTVANVLFLDSPAGVGYSGGNDSVYNSTGDISTAVDTYVFLLKWLERFPEYKSRDFFISGESYIGHYGPELAHIILQKNNPSINLKGLMMGNPLFDDTVTTSMAYEFIWSRNFYQDSLHDRLFKFCNFSEFYTSKVCLDIASGVEANWGDVKVFNLYAPTCDIFRRNLTHVADSVEAYDPCHPMTVESYMNLKKVQRALRARPSKGGVGLCTSEFIWQDRPANVYPLIKNLIANKIRLLVYSGDFDGRIPYTATKMDIKRMDLVVKTERPWYTNRQLGGYLEEYEGLLFVTIRQAGHEVPVYQPQRVHSVVYSFLNGELPSSESLP